MRSIREVLRGRRFRAGMAVRQCVVVCGAVLVAAVGVDGAIARAAVVPEPIVGSAAPVGLASGLSDADRQGGQRELTESVIPFVVVGASGVSVVSPAPEGTWSADEVLRFGPGVEPVGVAVVTDGGIPPDGPWRLKRVLVVDKA